MSFHHLQVQDSFPFSIGFTSGEGPISTVSNGVLFPKGHPFPSVKMLTLHRSNTFHIEVFCSDQNELPPDTSPKISKFTIGPFEVSNSKQTKVKVKVQLNLHGIVTVESASLIEDSWNDSTVRSDSHLTSEKAKADNGVSSDVANGSDDTHFTHSNASSTSGADEMKKGKVRRQDIPVSESVHGGMTRAELSQAQEKELQLAQQDIKVEQTKEKKNTLESYVYDMRNKIFHTYRSFATDSEKEGISRTLQQTEEWLYEDGDDESEHAYTEKLKDLQRLVDPVENRYKDEEARSEATRDLLNCIVENRMAVGQLPANQRDVVINECNKAEQWLREKTQQQNSLPKSADPVLWSSEIKCKTESLDALCKQLRRSKASPTKPEDDVDLDKKKTTCE
ncbi:unnamed protein product [Ilex paraguariensis]|uniref:Uncharacterized protein n=1 Tax=Ilex paraguariensis TaxID=185542 RepID=A0ABC8TBY3_9AQUA